MRAWIIFLLIFIIALYFATRSAHEAAEKLNDRILSAEHCMQQENDSCM